MLFRISLISLTLLLGFVSSKAQIVTSDPALPIADQPVTIYFDASQGTGGLKDFTGEVYAHTGVLTSNSSGASDWRYVKTDWGENTVATRLSRESANLYSLRITPNIRDYYGVPSNETITHLAFVFRSADSSLEGKDSGGADIYVEVFEAGLKVSIVYPDRNLIMDPGDTLELLAASSREARLSLYLNQVETDTATGSGISHSYVLFDPGDYWINVTAQDGEATASDSVFVHVKTDQAFEPLPSGLIDGINYLDAHTVQLVLYAPYKSHVFVVGDFNNWTPRSDSRMLKDGERFWITLNDLEAGEEYAFQYLVDGELQLADPYTEKTLDPSDKWIPEATYPGLKPYPEQGASGITAVLQTNQEPYAWSHPSFVPPPEEDLVIYELLVRDFVEAHNWKTLTDTLDYLSRLGINAIELMPFNEFEGNESWGYNPSFYFAVDKYYGPARDLKVFIDSCHGRGIAVIMDIVLNHSYGQSPLVQLYFDRGKVTSENPWYNVDSPNPVYQWGYDFDHESPQTQDFVDRVNSFWLDSFRLDGFRFDFTKGFTNTPGDGWAYDASRMAILKRMADVIWSKNPAAYVILEHLADNLEEMELAAHGMLLWGNMNFNYNEATMGYHADEKSDFSGISYQARLWNEAHLVGYMESHDEERLMFKNLTFGNSANAYDIQDLQTALQRMELAGAFFFPVPGPKMIWQFGELGYDYSIDEDCRVCNKPIRWDYYELPERRQVYEVWADLIRLKTSHEVFSSEDFLLVLPDEIKRIEISSEEMQVFILGNFGVSSQAVEALFPVAGTWYDFFSGESIVVEDPRQKIVLQAGQFHLFTSRPVLTPQHKKEGPTLLLEGKEFPVFPNPVSTLLHVDYWPEESTLTFTGMNGAVHLIHKLEAWEGQIDVSALPDGLFIVQRKTRTSSPEFVKILKISP